MLSEREVQQARELLLKKALKQWPGASGCLGVFVRPVRRSRWPQRILVLEHDACDWRGACCTGAVVSAWLIDDQGLRATTHEPKDVQAKFPPVLNDRYEEATVHFCIESELERAVWTTVSGPLAGFGSTYKVRRAEGEVSLAAGDGGRWIS